MYSAQVIDHFENPRGVGDLESATVTVERPNPVCGDVLRLSLRIENGRIAEARFKAKGCVPAIACGSKVVELISGQDFTALDEITADQISNELGGLPQASKHAAALAVDVLKEAVKKLS